MMVDVLRTLLDMSFWREFGEVDMRKEARMMHEYGVPLGDEVEVIGKTNGANEALRIEYPIRISDCILGGGFGIILPKGKDSHD